MKRYTKNYVLIGAVSAILVIGILILIIGACNGWFSQVTKETKTDITISVKFGDPQDGGAASSGLQILTDNKDTADATDDTYYRIVRYADTTTSNVNAQTDGILILDQSGTWLALGKADLTQAIELRIVSVYNTETQIRTTSFYMNKEQIELRANGLGAPDGVKITTSNQLVDSRETISGAIAQAATISNFAGEVYL